MSTRGPVNVAVVGLGFGEHFLPIYQAHPDVGEIAIVDPSVERLTEVGERFGIGHRFERFEDMLSDDQWDAVHVLAPVGFHAGYSVSAMNAGKHCACAVPMATELDQIDAIVDAQRRTGLVYTMMETTVFSAEYRAIERLYHTGSLGSLSMYQGFHIQNLDGFPAYWLGYPPMKYATHALSPILHLTGSTVSDVVAYGSGRLTPERIGGHDNAFPSEVALCRLSNSDIVADITVSFFQTARPFREGYSFHGDRMAVEWPQDERDRPTVFTLLERGDAAGVIPRGGITASAPLELDFGHELLPDPLRRFTADFDVVPAGGGDPLHFTADHGGSHPHLVHQFITAITESRSPEIDAIRAAQWTAPGIAAHESAARGGEKLSVPRYGSQGTS
jgi:predicted dehydrogenase